MVPLFLLMLVVASNAAKIADRQGKYYYPLDVHYIIFYILSIWNLIFLHKYYLKRFTFRMYGWQLLWLQRTWRWMVGGFDSRGTGCLDKTWLVWRYVGLRLWLSWILPWLLWYILVLGWYDPCSARISKKSMLRPRIMGLFIDEWFL